jgi:hypothetical protein
MKDSIEKEIDKVLKKHGDFIVFVKYNESTTKKTTESIDIKLKAGVVIYLVDFNKKSSRGTDADVVNKFNVSRADILNGSFAKSFDGFYKYDANGKLGLIMGLGYVFGNDVEIITPKRIGNLKTEEMNLTSLLLAHQANSSVLYEKKETAGRAKSDDSAKQGGAGIGAAKRKKEEVVTWVFSVHEITGISERSGAPIFAKGIKVKVNRAYYDSAQNFVKSKYSYQKTGKHYFVELDKIER